MFQLVFKKNGQQNSSPERVKKKSSKSTAREPVDKQIKHLLEKISDEDLRSFILQYSLDNREFRSSLMIRFAEDTGTVSFYRKIINTILNSAVKRNGFIERNRVGDVGLKVHQLMQQARKSVNNGNILSGIHAGIAVEERTKALQFADESNGDIGGNIEDALSRMEVISMI